jgi:DNA polymerase-3 subunit epsilon
LTETPWYLERMVGFDVESTGVDTTNDRILTVSLVDLNPGHDPLVETSTVWFDPGVEIPPEATKVHGIDLAKLRENNARPAGEQLPTLVNVMAAIVEKGVPLVGMNCPYDFGILHWECVRHGVPTLTEMLDPLPLAPVVDVLVLDRQVDKYRKGSRNLTALCQHYNVVLDGAHDSSYDALAALRLAWRLGRLNMPLRVPLMELHGRQVSWRAQQFAGFKEYKRGRGETVDGDGCWPVCLHIEGAPE